MTLLSGETLQLPCWHLVAAHGSMERNDTKSWRGEGKGDKG